MAIRVAIFEDRDPVREALSLLVKGTAGLELAGAFPNCNNVLEDVQNAKPEVILMDIEMPGMSGIEAVKIIKQHFPAIGQRHHSYLQAQLFLQVLKLLLQLVQ